MTELSSRYNEGDRVFTRTKLPGADLSGQQFIGCDFSGADFRGANLADSTFQSCNLRSVSFGAVDLTRADLRASVLVKADFSKSTLCSARLDGIEASEAKFVDAHASPADFTEQAFEHDSFVPTSFEQAELCEADLAGCRLDWASFESADLLGSNLARAHIWGTSFFRACIKDACLFETESQPKMTECVLNYRTYLRSGLDAERLAKWRQAGAVIEDFENFPLDILQAAHQSLSEWKQVEGNTDPFAPGKPAFDVAISFAGEDRLVATEIAEELRARGVHVFFDEYFQSLLWGKNLIDLLQEIYNKNSKFCLMLISKSYVAKDWTRHERAAAQARAFEATHEYILPIVIDNVEVPGLNKTVGYVHISEGPKKIASLVRDKLEHYNATNS